jgi:hypothetical protein
LPIGKADVALPAGAVLAPAGFRPDVTLTVPAGWHSTHRYPDAFDVSQPDPTADRPLLAVVIMTPAQSSAATAIAAIAGGTRVTGARLAGIPAVGVDVADGPQNDIVASRDRSMSFGLSPGERMRVLAADVPGGTIVVAVYVPDGANWDQRWAQALAVLDTLRLTGSG